MGPLIHPAVFADPMSPKSPMGPRILRAMWALGPQGGLRTPWARCGPRGLVGRASHGEGSESAMSPISQTSLMFQDPMSRVGPMGPVGPRSLMGLVDRGSPVGTVGPVGPASPMSPAGPWTSTIPRSPAGPTASADPMNRMTPPDLFSLPAWPLGLLEPGALRNRTKGPAAPLEQNDWGLWPKATAWNCSMSRKMHNS